MTEEKRNWFYKLRYTGWGRVLTFLLIIVISSAVGLGVYNIVPKQTDKETTDNYIRDYLAVGIYDRLAHQYNQASNTIKFKIDYIYEDGSKSDDYSADKFGKPDKIKKGDDNLVYLKGRYANKKVVFDENNVKDEGVVSYIEDIIKEDADNKLIETETSETINSSDENYIEKMREADTFSVADEDDSRYGKGDYGTFDGTMSITEAKEMYGEDVVIDIIPSMAGNEGYIYPEGEVTIYGEPVAHKLENADFVFTVDKADVINNPYFTNPIEKVILLGFLPAIVVALILILIFNGLSEYEKMKQIKYIKFLDSWFIDVVIAASIIALGMSFYAIDVYSWTTTVNIMQEYILKLIILGLYSILGLVIISYFILVIKGMYNNGIINTIKNKTLTLWLFKKLIIAYRKIRENLKRNIKDVGTLGVTGAVLITAVMAIIVMFFSVIFRAGGEGVWIILGIIAIAVTYTLIYNIIKNIKNINDTSSEIAKGNYDVKVDESMPYFRNIAHNFNTIGDNLTTAVEEQVKAERMRTELITNVSHDLKTPLTSIINYSKILIDEESSQEEKEEYAEVIHEKALKLKTLIEDLFQISKASSNNIEFEYEKLDFSALTLQAIGEWKDNFEERNLDIVFNKPDYPVVITLDGNRTYRVLDNLMGNIYKYAQENTRVYMDLKDDENEVELVIKNISAYELNITADELMERFTRGDKSRTTEGSGLGLSIASSLIEGQGGKFNINIDGDLFKVVIKLSTENS